MRILVIGGLAVAVAIAGFVAYRTWWGSSDAAVTYVTEQAAKTTLISSVSGTGNVTAGSTSSVAPTISGEVTDLSVQVGGTVTKGQHLFTLVNAQLDLDVQSAEANYQQAQQRLNTAELAVLQAEQSVDDLEDQQASQSANLPAASAVVLASYSPAPSNTPVRLASTGWPTTTSTTSTSDSTTTTSTSDSTTTTSTTSTTLPPTTLPPTTLSPTTLPPTTGPPITTPPTTSIPPTSQPGGGGATTPTTSKTVTDLDIAVAEQKVASARVDVTIAQSNLDSSEYALTQAKANAAARTVVAPTDGTVTAVNVSDGDDYGSTGTSSSASSGSGAGATSGAGGGTGAATSSGTSSSSSGGSAAVVITDLNSFEVTVALGETDVVAVTKGDKATLTFDALPDLTLVGKVDRVATVGAVSSGVVSYDVTVVPDTGNEQVRAGMTSTATIITESKVDALAVPSASVKTGQSGNTYVLVLKNGAPVQQTVQTGMTTDTYTEITGGLTEGQAVVTKTVGGATTATTARAGSGSILGGAGGGPPGGFPGGGGGFPGGGN